MTHNECVAELASQLDLTVDEDGEVEDDVRFFLNNCGAVITDSDAHEKELTLTDVRYEDSTVRVTLEIE